MALRTISTVVTASQSTALCTLMDVKEELGLGASVAHDAYLQKLIVRSSAAVVQYCNMVQVPETVQDRILPDPEAVPGSVPGSVSALKLSRFPVAEIVSVKEGGVAIEAETGFAFDGDAGLLYRLDAAGGIASWALPVVVVFQAGAAIPPDLADAAIRLVKARWFAKGRDPMLRSENIPGVREAQYWVAATGDDGNLPPDVQDLLTSYRAPVIA